MYKEINISEMRGMFTASAEARFLAVNTPSGFLLTFGNCELLTFRGEKHFFKSFDSLILFVQRHFVDVYSRSAVVETIVSSNVSRET